MELTLLEKAINGDKKALKELITQNSEYIYKLAFIHTKYENDAIQIMKNTIEDINSNIRKFSKFKSFDKHITRTTLKHINEYIKNVGIIQYEEDTNYLNKNGYIDMYKAIDLLDNYEKNIIVLLYFYKMSYKEIGDILDMNESTVKMYVRNSLKLMQNVAKEENINGK